VKWDSGSPRSAWTEMPVTSWICFSNDFLSPSRSCCEKNSTHRGAMSSCSVQPRVNYRLFRNWESLSSSLVGVETSARNT
jgi:hypothetical protein